MSTHDGCQIGKQSQIPCVDDSPNIGRYDDIWAGYIVLAIADHLDHAVAFGFPLVKQARRPPRPLRVNSVNRRRPPGARPLRASGRARAACALQTDSE